MLAGLFFLALAVRLWRLTYHSLWFDEAVSAYWAGRPAAKIIHVGMGLTLDRHPPVYYLLLRAWTLLFGSGDAAVRSLGVLLGALAVFPIYALARRWGGRLAGCIAALLFALNPFLVWYAQEARMFMPAATFALFGFWGLTRALEMNTPRDWGVFVLATLAGLYAYLFNALLLPVAGLWWLVAIARAWRGGERHRARWIAWTGSIAFVVTAIAFLPLARQAWLVSGREFTPGHAFADVVGTLWRLGHAFMVHKAPSSALGDFAVITGAVALAIGLAPGGRGQTGRAELAIALAVPWLEGNLLLARDQAAFAEPRYWLFLVPFLCIAWALAVARLASWGKPGAYFLAGGVLSILVVTSLVALPWDWHPEKRREDWRAAARYIESHAGPNDAILIHVDYVRTAFLRYYRGDLPVYFPFGGPVRDMKAIAPPLEGMAKFDTIWLVESHLAGIDDDRLVERWLNEHYPLATEQFPAGITLRAYAVRLWFKELPPGVKSLSARLAPGVTLAGCHLGDEVVTAQDNVYHPPSGWVHVTLYWRRTGNPAAGVRPRLPLIDGMGQVWGMGLDRARGVWALHPPESWPPNRLLRDEHDINLNPITPPGEYRVVVALTGPDGQLAGNEVTCGTVQVVRR
ncbi:MAG: glycosyltransferase family 39 protein [Anaerolineae bacterium]|nr:glycosyltransferase family 39 protein [Anaerolineae bacterium]